MSTALAGLMTVAARADATRAPTAGVTADAHAGVRVSRRRRTRLRVIMRLLGPVTVGCSLSARGGARLTVAGIGAAALEVLLVRQLVARVRR